MYNCDTCKKPTGPRIGLNLVPKEERPKDYIVETEDGPKTTFGREIDSELKLCPTCAKVKPRTTNVVNRDHSASVTLGLSLQGHGKRCKDLMADCSTCQRNLRTYASLPLPAIQRVLEEPRIHTGRITIGAMLLDSMMRRTYDKSKRSSADFTAAYPVLKAYEQRGGRI